MLSVRVTADHNVVVREVPDPVPAPNESIIEVVASTVNRGELALIGMRPAGWAPGQDVAGVVASQASDGSGPPAGTRVIGLAEEGGWSERVAVQASRLATVPDDVDLATAAALPMAGLTALRTLRKLGSVLGRDVLVTGAAGGVGGLQVQLAALSGARVTALVRTERTLPGVQTITALVGAGPFDAALESVGGDVFGAVVPVLRPGADLVWFGSTSGKPAPMSIYDFIGHEGVTVHTYFSYAADTTHDTRDLETLLGLVHAGRLKIETAVRWSITDAAQAVQQLAAGGIHGKILLTAHAHRGV
jgi:NADPH2:quinone reductase